MDLTQSIAPKSDQLNAEDLLSGPRTVTVEQVAKGSAEQPVNVHLAEFPGRPFRPSKTVRRILVSAWGADAATYAGRRMTLYRDASVRFGGQDVGGIRVSHLSHIDKPITIALTVTRGKRAPHTVHPLPAERPASRVDAEPAPPALSLPDFLATVAATADEAALRDMWSVAGQLAPENVAEGRTAVTDRRAVLLEDAANAQADDDEAALDAAMEAEAANG